MKKYRGVVVFRYYQTIEVEAEDDEQAERLMFEKFDLGKADGESEVNDLEEMK
jgi:hypothetical protein